MADDVRIGGKSREEVAFSLLESIAFVEGKAVVRGTSGEKADRDYILKTYHQCLQAVIGVPPND